MGLLEARQAIVDTVKTKMTELWTVITYGGEFTQDELERIATKIPGAYVACNTATNIKIWGNAPIADVDWVMSVVAKDKPPKKRNDLILEYVDKIMNFLPQQLWGYNGFLTLPFNIRYDNAYTLTLDSTLASKADIRWTQRVSLAVIVDPDTLNDLESIGIDYFLQQPADDVKDAHDEVVFP